MQNQPAFTPKKVFTCFGSSFLVKKLIIDSDGKISSYELHLASTLVYKGGYYLIIFSEGCIINFKQEKLNSYVLLWWASFSQGGYFELLIFATYYRWFEFLHKLLFYVFQIFLNLGRVFMILVFVSFHIHMVSLLFCLGLSSVNCWLRWLSWRLKLASKSEWFFFFVCKICITETEVEKVVPGHEAFRIGGNFCKLLICLPLWREAQDFPKVCVPKPFAPELNPAECLDCESA